MHPCSQSGILQLTGPLHMQQHAKPNRPHYMEAPMPFVPHVILTSQCPDWPLPGLQQAPGRPRPCCSPVQRFPRGLSQSLLRQTW